MNSHLNNRSTRNTTTRRNGSVLIYVTLAMGAIIAFATLGVDFGRLQLAKVEASRSADAAARAAARMLADGNTAAADAAVALAKLNTVDGQPVVLNRSSDIEVGKWDKTLQTFTPGIWSPNAVRVTVRRTSARGNPIQLAFAGLIGQSTCDVSASAIATASGDPGGFIGLNGVSFKNNTFVGSYRSSAGLPNKATALSNAMVGSNVNIGEKNNTMIRGDLMVGPGGTINDTPNTGSTIYRTTAIPTPVLPVWAPQANPAGVPMAYVAKGDITLPAGNYWFTSLDINGNLTFAGPATLYIDGNITIRGTLSGYNARPGNLNVYQYGSHTLADDGTNHLGITAVVIAPYSNLVIKNNAQSDITFAGSGTFNTITIKNNAQLMYDENLGSLGGKIQLVK